jgi:hypothetical protein
MVEITFRSIFDAETEFMAAPKGGAPKLMRHEVLLFKGDEPFHGYVVTFQSIEKWCEAHGYRLDKVYSSSPAHPNQETVLL